MSVWKAVEGYPNYAVSIYGSVKNVNTGKILKTRAAGLESRGYLRVQLFRDGRPTDFHIQNLVAQTYLKDYKHGLFVAHRDGDTSNNAVENLYIGEWPKPIGGKPPKHGTMMIRIVETGEVFHTARLAAKHVNGSFSGVYLCLRGKRKKHKGFTFEQYQPSGRR